MRIRVRVTAPGEGSPQARRTSERSDSYRSRTQITRRSPAQPARRDGVVYRLGKQARTEALPQPVNNAGEAIRASAQAGLALGGATFLSPQPPPFTRRSVRISRRRLNFTRLTGF